MSIPLQGNRGTRSEAGRWNLGFLESQDFDGGVVEIPPGAQKHLDSTVDDKNPALKDPKLWELWYSPYYGSCRI